MSRSEIKIATAGTEAQTLETAIRVLKADGYQQTQYKSEDVWRRGKGVLTGIQYVKLAYTDGELNVTVWSTEATIKREQDLNRMALIPRKNLMRLLTSITRELAVYGPAQKKADLLKEAAIVSIEPENTAPETEQQEKLKPLVKPGMKYTPLTKKALSICFEAHKSQTDQSGLPYVFHPFHVAEMLETEEEICTALLHDVVEDTDWTIQDLREQGFPEPVLEAVALMTHEKSVPYLEYVAKIRANPIARRVKLADLTHNSDPDRLSVETPATRARRQKYAIAKAVLEDDAYDGHLNRYRKRIPLDLRRYYFLSVFYDKEGTVLKYSLDVEAASDSHYEFDVKGGEKLRAKFPQYASLPEALADFFAVYTLSEFVTLLSRLGIGYQEFHYG